MRNIFLSGLLYLLAFSSEAQEKLPANFFMKKLNNGLQVLVIEDNSVPLATIEIVVKNGAYTESPEYDGLSHLYEHMFFKANKDLPSQEKFMERVSELGVVFNGTTSNERVNYFITLNNSKIKEGLEIDHIDGDKHNNDITNLRAINRSENMLAMHKRKRKLNPIITVIKYLNI